MKVFMFPGQASQQPGMGRELFERFPHHVAQADALLGYSLRDLCLDDYAGRLNDTRYTQPALYVVSALAGIARMEDSGPPDFCVGHSLGEYAALFVAGALDFASGVALVRARGALMGEINGGAMAAVIGLPGQMVERIISESGIPDVTIANYNSPDQIVVGGTKPALERLMPLLKAGGCKLSIPLKVSGAFHTQLMAPAAARFEAVLASIEFRPLKTPVIANVTARAYAPTAIRTILTQQITSPVRWHESIVHLLEKGATDFHELGPGSVLTNLLEKIQRSVNRPQAQPADRLNPTSGVEHPQPTCDSLPVASSPKYPAAPVDGARHILPEALGSASFRSAYGLKYAYIAGAMYKGIASAPLVIAMGKAGLLSFFGTAGLSQGEIETGIREIRAALAPEHPYGMNLVCNLEFPDVEARTVQLFLHHDIRTVEAAAYIQPTSHVVCFRLSGAKRRPDGSLILRRIIAKVSHPEVAESFMRPPSELVLRQLVQEGRLTEAEAALGSSVPVASDICVEADSGGHTDRAVALTLFPSLLLLRDQLAKERTDQDPIHIGSAGGIGDPNAAAAVFLMGADFILTGSINQCTLEAGISDAVKDMLQNVDVRDTTYAPAGDMFEVGSKVQVLRKGVLFPARANHLYELYTRHNSWEDIDVATRHNIETRYFGKSVEEVWNETRTFYLSERPEIFSRAEADPKKKLALLFRWYFVHSTRLAFAGNPAKQVDFQVHCGSALGAFNRWVRNTPLKSWRRRSAPDIAQSLMISTASLLNQRWGKWVEDKHG